MCCFDRTLTLLKISTTVIIITFLFHLIGFSAPYWCQTSNCNEGLWEVCQDGVCTSSLDTSVNDQAWFIVVQVMMTLSIGTAATVMILVFIVGFTEELSENRYILFTATVLSFLTGMFIIISVLVYAMRGWVFFEHQSGSDFTFGFAFIVTSVAVVGWKVVGIILAVYLAVINAKLRKQTRERNETVETDGTSEPYTPQPDTGISESYTPQPDTCNVTPSST